MSTSAAAAPSLRGYPAEHADLDVAVPPLSYNPSAWRRRIPICLLAFAAFLIAGYLSLYQWRLVGDVWDPLFGDQSNRVLDSEVAKRLYHLLGIHDAALGAMVYLGDAVFGLAGSTRRWQYQPWLVIVFGLFVFPPGIAGTILVILQATVVGNWCLLCIITAVISLTLIYLAYGELSVTLRYLYRVWHETRSKAELWAAVWGHPREVSDQVAVQMLAGSDVATEAA